MESISWKSGISESSPAFASSRINQPVDHSNILRESIDTTYDTYGGRVFDGRNIKRDTIMPVFGGKRDGIRANLISLAQHQGRADALTMIEIARLDNEHRASLHNLKETVQNATEKNKAYTESSVRDGQLSAKNHTDMRISETRASIQGSVQAQNENIRIINRKPDLEGQVREAIIAVKQGNQTPQQQAARFALQEMADSSSSLTQFGGPLEDVPSRLERITYVSARNTALAIAGVKNLERDHLETTAKLATLSLSTQADLQRAFADLKATSSRVVRNTYALQDQTSIETAKQVDSLDKSITELERHLTSKINTVRNDLRNELEYHQTRHASMVDDLNTKMIEFYDFVNQTVDDLHADGRNAIHENNRHLLQQFHEWDVLRDSQEQAKDTENRKLKIQLQELNQRFTALEDRYSGQYQEVLQRLQALEIIPSSQHHAQQSSFSLS